MDQMKAHSPSAADRIASTGLKTEHNSLVAKELVRLVKKNDFLARRPARGIASRRRESARQTNRPRARK
jgi:hypothetical protein